MLKIMNLGHKEVSPEIATKGEQLVTRLLILHKELIAVHRELGGFEDADPTSMSQRTDLKWQSACGGLWWCLDYLILRLATIKRALMTIEDGTTNGTTKTDLLLYPMVDIHFFKQNLAALRALHDGSLVLGALSKIASRFLPEELNEKASAAQERTRTESMSAQTVGLEPNEEQAILDFFRDAQEVADKRVTTDADGMVTCRLGLYRKADALKWKSRVPATTLMKLLVVPRREPANTTSPAHIASAEDAKRGKHLFGETNTRFNDTDNADDNVPKVSISAFHPGRLPGAWALPPYSALSIDDSEGFPSPHQPVHVWAERRERERQKLLTVQSEAIISGSYQDEEGSNTKMSVSEHPPALVIGDGQDVPLESRTQSRSADSRPIATVQADAGPAKNADVFDGPRQYRVSEFNTDNVSKLSRWTDMTSASRLANDLSLPVHRAIRMDPKHLKDVLVYKASDAYINAKDRQGLTPLELAVTNMVEAPEAAHDLVAAEVDVTKPCLGYSNALLATIRRQHFGLALFIAQEVPNQVGNIVNDRDAEGLSALLLVARFVADSHFPHTPFVDSPQFNQETLCLALITCGADVKMQTNDELLTALHFAARHRILALVERLIDEEADVNAADNRGWTPLHEAVMAGYVPDVVAALMEGGADPHIADKSGITPLGLARGWRKMAETGRLSIKEHKEGTVKFNNEVALREVNGLIAMLESVSSMSQQDMTLQQEGMTTEE